MALRINVKETRAAQPRGLRNIMLKTSYCAFIVVYMVTDGLSDVFQCSFYIDTRNGKVEGTVTAQRARFRNMSAKPLFLFSVFICMVLKALLVLYQC